MKEATRKPEVFGYPDNEKNDNTQSKMIDDRQPHKKLKDLSKN